MDQGDLYVADSGNNRVLRFRKPFTTPAGSIDPGSVHRAAELQREQTQLSARTNHYANGKGHRAQHGKHFTAAITFDAQHNLWFTDAGNNRVLRYAASDVAKGGFATTIGAEPGNRSARFRFAPAQLANDAWPAC